MARPKKSTQEATKLLNSKNENKISCMRCGCTTQSNFYQTKDVNRKHYMKLPYCKECVRFFYDYYLKIYEDVNLAIYYMCRKIDIPYIHSNFLGALENVNNQNAKIQGEDVIVSAYMKGLSFSEKNGWGYTFDDSQGENYIEKLDSYDVITKVKRNRINNPSQQESDDYEVIEYDTGALQSKWGNTFENWELSYLEGEYLDWEEKLNGINDKTIDILVKQICYQLLDIYKDRQAGTAVDKKIRTLRELMNDSGLMEKQNKAMLQKSNIGMTIRDIEFHKPIPTSTPVFDDVDGIKNYIFGAAGCYFKATGVENVYTKFYDKWMKDYSVDLITDMVNEKEELQRHLETEVTNNE